MTTDSGKSYLKMDNIDGPFKPNPKSLDGVPDLCMLTYLGELNVLHNLEFRYKKQEVYTSTTAKVVVAINPYEAMPQNYTEEKMKAYQEQASNLEGLADKNSLPPHLFWVANSAYANLTGTGKNQSIIVCGESGSGKTESAKYMMRFLAFTTTSKSVDASEFEEANAIGQQVLDANPILESFGNAKTLINNNSSRFGKFTKMLFREGKVKGEKKLVGAGIDTYLLEKSRVVYQDQGERNYHIFYQLTHCRDKYPELKLKAPDQHKFSGQAKCWTLDDLRYTNPNTADIKWNEELEEAWKVLKIPREDSMACYAVVGSVLHLGDVQFDDKPGEGCNIGNPDTVKTIADLLGLDEKKVAYRLQHRTLVLPGNQLLEKPLNPPDAAFNRDSWCRSMYNGLFRWVVNRINKVSFPPDGDSLPTYIGILDVFGFEIFANNSFEQFCINFANERLQQYFNEHVLMAEQILYQREALLWNPIELPDNQQTIDLFTSKPYGIYAILDSTCIQPKGDDKVFTENLFKQHKFHPKMRKTDNVEGAGVQKQSINGITIKHYAGAVLYNAADFLVKNSDSSEFDTVELLYQSSKTVVQQVLLMKPDGKLDTEKPVRSQKRAFLSTGSVFSEQLSSLMGELKKTAPYFVRCVKPNPKKQPKTFIGDFVRPQLRCGGLIEALRIIKLGFPTRCKYARIVELFSSVLKKKPVTNLNARDFSQAIMIVLGDQSLKPAPDEYQMGLTQIFFRPGKQQYLTDILEKDAKTVTDDQVAKIRQILTAKRWVRAAGVTRGWIRTNSYLSTSRFTKSAITMCIIYKVFGKVLRQARNKLNGNKEEEEARKRLMDAEFQAALKAKKDLEAFQAREAERRKAMEDEKNRINKSMSDKEAEVEAERQKTAEAEQKYQQAVEARSQAQAKAEEAEAKANAEAADLNSKVAACDARVTQAETDVKVAEERVKAAEKLAGELREEHRKKKEAAGAGKEEYEKQLADKRSKLAQVEAQLAQSKADRARDEEENKRQIADKDARIAQLQAKLKQVESDRVQQKEDSAKSIADKQKDIEAEEAKLKAVQAREEAERNAAKEQAAKLRDEVEEAKKQLREQKSALEGEVASMEKDNKAKKEEMTRITEVEMKEKDKEIERLREELKGIGERVKKAKEDAANDIELARIAQLKANEKMESDLSSASKNLIAARNDLAQAEKERDETKIALERDIETVKKEVAAEHIRLHHEAMEQKKTELNAEIETLNAKQVELEKQLAEARAWKAK